MEIQDNILQKFTNMIQELKTNNSEIILFKYDSNET